MTAPGPGGVAGDASSGAAFARWDAQLYAGNTAHHRAFDDVILRGVDVAPTARIVDLGCGVGDFTCRLADLVPAGEVVGVDADPAMIQTAWNRPHPPRVRYAVASAQHLDAVVAAASADAVVSVATLHWVPAADQPAALRQIAAALRPGGFVRADLGGHGQIEHTRAVLDAIAADLGGGRPRWFFPTASGYAVLLRGAGLRVDAVLDSAAGGMAEPAPAAGWVRLLRQRRALPDAAAVRGWLTSQRLVAYDETLPAGRLAEFRDRALHAVESRLRRADGSYDQDYVRIDLLARKPPAAPPAGDGSA